MATRPVGRIESGVHQQLIRALVAAQVAVIEHADEVLGERSLALPALEECLREAAKLTRQLRKDEPG